MILGDDVAIANAEVAKNYADIMKTIGVDISLSKRVIPVTGYSS
jgi:hypothetical protein